MRSTKTNQAVSAGSHNGTVHFKNCKQLFEYQHFTLRDISGLYYKHVMIVNDNSIVIIK
jgi:hypothetical protein